MIRRMSAWMVNYSVRRSKQLQRESDELVFFEGWFLCYGASAPFF